MFIPFKSGDNQRSSFSGNKKIVMNRVKLAAEKVHIKKAEKRERERACFPAGPKNTSDVTGC